jgi:hypothetical protein
MTVQDDSEISPSPCPSFSMFTIKLQIFAIGRHHSDGEGPGSTVPGVH